jgi:hypothetical protein
MPRKVIDRADHFDDDDELEGTDIVPSSRPYMPMSEADAVRNGQFPTTRHPPAKELLEQVVSLQEQLVQAKAAGQVLGAEGTINVYNFQLTPSGMIAPDGARFEDWEQVGHLLFRLEGSIQWLVGDWLLYGEQVKWGETDEIAKALGRETQTLYHYKSICLAFEFCRRRQNLTFGHHEAVRRLSHEDQERALDYAEQEGVSVAAFRKWLKGSVEEDAPALPTGLFIETPRPALSGLEKLAQRDPSTLKPKQVAEGLGYITQARQWLDEMEQRLRGQK